MKNQIRYISLDAAGTLIKVRGSVGDIYAEVASRFGMHFEPGILEKEFKIAFQNAPPLCFPKIDPKRNRQALLAAEKNWWREIVGAVFKESFSKPGDFERFFNTLYRVFSEKDSWEIYEDVLPGLTLLQERGFQLGVLSNFDSRLHKILKDLGCSEFFERVICSSEAGAAKPAVEFFEKSLPGGLRKEEILHVGDRLDLDVRPAQALGIKALWLDRRDKREIPKTLDCREIRITSLRNIADFISENHGKHV